MLDNYLNVVQYRLRERAKHRRIRHSRLIG